jgi:hypothetical protein
MVRVPPPTLPDDLPPTQPQDGWEGGREGLRAEGGGERSHCGCARPPACLQGPELWEQTGGTITHFIAGGYVRALLQSTISSDSNSSIDAYLLQVHRGHHHRCGARAQVSQTQALGGAEMRCLNGQKGVGWGESPPLSGRLSAACCLGGSEGRL